MGCWPIAGIRSVDVNEADSLATLRAALDSGVNFFDTAYCYGYHGESERLIARALGTVRGEIVIASKGGIHWGPDQQQVLDGRPETIRRECDESLKRLATDRIDLHYLHAPDPKVPVSESAGAFRELIRAGKILSAGLSNATKEQLAEFHAVCPLTAYQPPYNMLQREVESSQLPWCVANDVAAIIYWPLMKGLLAGKLPRNHVFAPNDSRRKYPMFNGTEWQKNQDFLDRLRPLAAEAKVSISQLVLNWTIHRQGITVALCGAKRADQIRDNAGAMHFRLSERQLVRIDDAIFDRGPIVSRTPV
jgi:aryl-alcohol dehydrogenase-like predicted oxidoreductase